MSFSYQIFPSLCLSFVCSVGVITSMFSIISMPYLQSALLTDKCYKKCFSSVKAFIAKRIATQYSNTPPINYI